MGDKNKMDLNRRVEFLLQLQAIISAVAEQRNKHHKDDKRVQIYMVTRMHMLMHEGTYWGEWWHRAVWPPELQLWDHQRRAGPRGYTTACFHGCHKHTRARSVYWCCSEWGSHCLRSPQAGSTCSSHAGWNLPSASGYWQCYLWMDANGMSVMRCFT